MILSDRFTMQPTQKQTYVQLECPVYIHCTRRFSDRRSGTNFLQVRMVNCSERLVCEVYLRIEGFDRNGERCFIRNDVILADCNALPHTIFGEKRILSLGTEPFSSLQVTVLRICFADGMIWRRRPGHKLTDSRAFPTCSCGMKILPNTTVCPLCSRNHVKKATREVTSVKEFKPVSEVKKVEFFDPVISEEVLAPAPAIERPAPIVRPQPFYPEVVPQEPKTSRAWKISLAIFLILTALVLSGLFLYAHSKHLI